MFVTTKCFNTDHGYEQATHALKLSLGRLEMEHVDLYLIHWPVPATDLYVETWQALIDAQKAGLAREIGVSNFQPAHLERIEENVDLFDFALTDEDTAAIERLDAGHRTGPDPDTFVRPGA